MRDADSGWIQLHPGELFLLWSSLAFGELPAILDIPHIGRTEMSRAQLIDAASHALAGRELGTVSEPARDLAQLLRTLADAGLMLDMHTDGDGPSFRAVGASGDRGAVSLGVAGPDVRIGPVRPSAMVATMLEALPPVPPGVGSSANARVADYERACARGKRDGPSGFRAALRAAGMRPPEVNTFVRTVTTRAGGGRMGASVSTGSGRWARSPEVLTWVDTPEGRYLFTRKGDWVTATPADPARLRGVAEEMVADLVI